jgi:hypothetical protein
LRIWIKNSLCFQASFEAENEANIDALQTARYPEIISNSWLYLRLQVVGMSMIVAVALVAVLARDTIEPGAVGLTLSYAIICQLDLFLLVRLTGDIEKSIVSVERIKEYQVRCVHTVYVFRKAWMVCFDFSGRPQVGLSENLTTFCN